MSLEADDLDIKIEPDDKAPAADIVLAPADDKAPVVKPEDGIDALKAKLAESEATADRERSARRAAEEREAGAKAEVQDTNVQLVTNAINTLKLQTTEAKAKFAEAMAAQDFDAVAEAQEQISELAAKRLTLEGGLEQLKAQPKPTAEPIVDPVEKLAKQLTPKSAQWVRAHPEFASGKKYQMMLGAHNLAVGNDLGPETQEYFNFVEKTLGVGQAAEPTDDALSAAAEPTARRQSPVAAPVSRGVNGNGSAPTTVRLTAAEREAAASSGMTDQEYARNKLALIKEGRLH